MNRILAKIAEIQTSDGIILVDLTSDGIEFSALLIDSHQNPDWLMVGSEVNVIFKESEVSLAKNLSGLISLRNRFNGIIEKIEWGKLLTVITIKCQHIQIVSAITTRSANMLELKPGDEIMALVKANEISLMQK